MSSRDHTHGAPYVQKINLSNHDSRRTKRRPPKLCSDCNESNNYIRIFSNKVSRIEEIINNFDKNLQKKNANQFSIFNAKFTLNNVPCELEYDLSKFTLENLLKLGNITTQIYNNENNDKFNKNKLTSSNENINNEGIDASSASN